MQGYLRLDMQGVHVEVCGNEYLMPFHEDKHEHNH